MVMALDASAVPEEYICVADRTKPPTEQTVFLIVPLTGHVAAQVRDGIFARARRQDGVVEEHNTLNVSERLALLYGLVGWKNFRDSHGAEVPFLKDDQAANLTRLPFDIWDEVSHVILNKSQLMKVQRKN